MYKNFFALVCIMLASSLYSHTHSCGWHSLRMHSKPSELSEVVSEVIWAEPVELLESNGAGWAKVKSGDDYQGWVFKLALVPKNQDIYPAPSRVARVLSRLAHVYWSPDHSSYPPLMTLPYGALLEVFDGQEASLERWVPVRLLDGQVAYIRSDDIELNPPLMTPEEMCEQAMTFIGIPYTWGGRSAFGFDCSGFTQSLYRLMGIQIPRDAKPQSEMAGMVQVPLQKAVAGDLLFFSDRDDKQVDHVGIYLEDGFFIHSSSDNVPPSVQVSSLSDWSEILVKCGHVERS